MVIKAETDGHVVGKVTLLKKTEQSIQVEVANGERVWFPASHIHDDSEIHETSPIGEVGRLVITQWLAERRR